MNNKRIIGIASFLLLIVFSFQNDKLKQIASFPFDQSTQVYVDAFENTYIIKGNQITKYESDSINVYEYNSNSDGMIHSLDVSNPYKIIVFHKDNNSYDLLDKQLVLIQTDAENFFETEISAYINSVKGGYWKFDQEEQRLISIDNYNKVLNKSSEFSLFTTSEINIEYMLEANNQVYINNANDGIYIFDDFANYIKKIPFKFAGKFQVYKDELHYRQFDSLFSLNMRTYEEDTMIFHNAAIQDIYVMKQKIYCLDSEKLNIYQYK